MGGIKLRQQCMFGFLGVEQTPHKDFVPHFILQYGKHSI